MAKPLTSRTNAASARCTPSAASSTVLAPLHSTSTASSPRRKTSDLTICPTSQPMAAAASAAVRVPSGNSRAPGNPDAASDIRGGDLLGDLAVAERVVAGREVVGGLLDQQR